MMLCERKGFKQRVPLIFTNHMVHSDMAKWFKVYLLRDHGFNKVDPVSAGDYNPMLGTCSGESESLRLKADPGDAVVIQMYDYMHGVVQ